MPAIRLSETEILDAKRIGSFKASDQESPESGESEKFLTITMKDGQTVTLRGTLAEDAHLILRLNGF